MRRSLQLLLLLSLFRGTLDSRAQEPARPPASEPQILRALPRIPDEPRALKEAAAPQAAAALLPGSYFEEDLRLDPPEWPRPGWFADVDLSAMGAHFKNRLVGSVQVGGSPPSTLHVPGAELDWTLSPRFEGGYRLPSGFGAFGLSYRLLATDGTQAGPGLDGPAAQKSRLDLHIIDLDYISREYSVWPAAELWKMQWRFGLRLASIYYDANAVESSTEAAAGGGILAARATDHFIGIGPHVGVELARQLQWNGLSCVGRVDSWISLGHIRQDFIEESTTLGPSGMPLSASAPVSSSQSVTSINTQLGLGYQPPAHPNVELFLGYQYEYWWNVGRFSKSTSRGELSDQGVTFRIGFNY
jgi:hypothetical protein